MDGLRNGFLSVDTIEAGITDDDRGFVTALIRETCTCFCDLERLLGIVEGGI